MLKLENISAVFNKDTINEKYALDDISLEINDGDFISVIGSNGAGKSTLLNVIAGLITPYKGKVINNCIDISKEKDYSRAKYMGHLYQDPLKGTAGNMTIAENLALAYNRKRRFCLDLGLKKSDKKYFYDVCKKLNLSLEDRLDAPVSTLSGGQRQALTLLMATLNRPSILLLDEHTAALDPHTSKMIMDLTDSIVKENNITTLMITHNIENALKYGNKTLVMSRGKIIKVLEGKERETMMVNDIIDLFSKNKDVLADDIILV